MPKQNLNNKEGIVVVISGPSGVGKSTICNRLISDMEFKLSVSATSRRPRANEKNGVDYLFMSKEEFEKGIEENAFIEYVKLFNNYYGTLLKPIIRAIEKGERYLLDIDVNGAIALRKKKVEGLYVLIAPPDIKTLEERLKGRKTETEQQLAERLKLAKWELQQKRYYNYVIINDSLEKTVKKLKSLVIKYKKKKQ
ncbi:MAG: guanylate kinase [Planctomycetota bacterium]